MSDDKKPNPDDAPIVTSLDDITADGPVLWTSDAMVTQGGGAIFAIPDDGARGSWREPWPSAEGAPMHVLSAPVYQDEMPVYTGSAPFGRCPSWRQPVADDETSAIAAPPTDAEIVAMMELCAREEHSAFTTAPAIQVRGVLVSRAECQAAWSRVLAAKVAASDAARTEAARRVVLGPIDGEGEA